MTTSQLLAQVDPERVTPGLLGFLVILAIGLATWGLLRSLNHHLKRVRFEESARPEDEAAGRRPGSRDGAVDGKA